jgi:hypothetical protein
MPTPWKDDPDHAEDSPDAAELARTIDTTIPENKLAHVEKLKKAIRGGALSERSLYREVPTPEEMDAIKFTGNFIPNIAPNAEELISFALSHIPEKTGPRRSRHKKRMAHKWEVKRTQDAKRKADTIAAREAKHAKLQKHRQSVKKILKQAKNMQKNNEHAAAVRAKLAAAAAGSDETVSKQSI